MDDPELNERVSGLLRAIITLAIFTNSEQK
jgi:hypothetical protein